MVTGGGRGIGAATVRLLAGEGAVVAACSRSGQGLGDLATEGVAALTAAVDVAEADAVASFAAEVAERLGPPAVLVNNAAVLGPVGPLLDLDAAEWATTLATNVGGVVHASQAFGRRMVASGDGVIVNLSGGGVGGPSMAGRMSAYTTSKAAVVALTETLARELAGTGVRVNAVAPGAMATGFNDAIVHAGPEVAGADLYEATLRNDRQPAPFDDFARLLLYVVSSRAAWLTGCLLSARWDDPDSLERRRSDIERSSLLRLRRIDGDLFHDAKLPRQ